MKYDVTKCNNLNFKQASGPSGFMKVSPKGNCYFYQHDEIWDVGTMMLQPRFWRAVDFAEFNRVVEVNRIQIVPRNPETYTEWKVGDKVISNTGNKVNTIIAVLGKAIVLVRDAEVPITTLTSADDLTKYNKLVLTDYEKELIHAQEPEKKKNGPFKNGDRVLARDNDDAPWQYDIFYFYEEESSLPYCCETGQYQQCIPLNDHTWKFLGTTKEYKEE